MNIEFEVQGIKFRADVTVTAGERGCETLANGDPGHPESEPEVTVDNLTVIDTGELSAEIDEAALAAYMVATRVLNQP